MLHTVTTGIKDWERIEKEMIQERTANLGQGEKSDEKKACDPEQVCKDETSQCCLLTTREPNVSNSADPKIEPQPEESQDGLTKILELCDTLLREQDVCQNVVKGESKEVSQTEELTDTMDDLKSELKFYRYLLAENLKHAPAMLQILKGIRKDVERLLKLAEGMTRNGVLPQDGGKIIPNLEGQWYVMGELMERLSVLTDRLPNNTPIDPEDAAFETTIAVDQVRGIETVPLAVELRDAKIDFEEAMEAFHAFVLSENVQLKNASTQTEGSTQTFEFCVDPSNAFCIVEESKPIDEYLSLRTVSTQTGHFKEETPRVGPTQNSCDSAETPRCDVAPQKPLVPHHPIPALMSITFEPRMISRFKTMMSRSRFPLIRGFAGGNPPVRPWSENRVVRNFGVQSAGQSVPGRSPIAGKTFDPGATYRRHPFPQPYGNGSVQYLNCPWEPPVIYYGIPQMNRCPFTRPNFPIPIQPATGSRPMSFPGWFCQIPAPMMGSNPPAIGGWSTGVYSPALWSQQKSRMIRSC
jgi:hypothetical protein